MRRVSFAALAAALTACNGNGVVPGSPPPRFRSHDALVRLRRGAHREGVCPGCADSARLPTRLGRSRSVRDKSGTAADSGPSILRRRGRVDRSRGKTNDQLLRSAQANRRIVAVDRHRRLERNVQSPPKRKNGKWHTYPSTDILQAGSESDVPCYKGGPLEKYKTIRVFLDRVVGVRNIRGGAH